MTNKNIIIGVAILFALVLLWKFWYKPMQDKKSGTKESGYKKAGCASRSGVDCCRPNRWVFNSSTNEYQCSGGAN